MKYVGPILGALIVALVFYVAGIQTGFVVQRTRDTVPMTLHAKCMSRSDFEAAMLAQAHWCEDYGTECLPGWTSERFSAAENQRRTKYAYAHPDSLPTPPCWFADDAGKLMQVRVRDGYAYPYYPTPRPQTTSTDWVVP